MTGYGFGWGGRRRWSDRWKGEMDLPRNAGRSRRERRNEVVMKEIMNALMPISDIICRATKTCSETKTESHRVERGRERNHDMKKTEFTKIHKSTYLWILLEGEEIIGRVQNSVKLIGMEYRTSFPEAREGAIRGDGGRTKAVVDVGSYALIDDCTLP